MPVKAPQDRKLSRLSEQRRPVAGRLIAFVVALCLLLAGLHAWHVWETYANELEEAEISTGNMARALAAQAETSLKVGSVILADMVERMETDGNRGAAAARLHARLAAVVRHTPEVHGLFVYGPDGEWLVTSLPKPVRGNNADRDYFQYHLAHTDRAVHVGKPIRSRSTGVWIIPLSRRVDRPDGSFGGVVLVTLNVGFFGRLYDRFDIGRQGTILLATDDGTLIYRRPFRDSLVGTPIGNGPVMQMVRKSGPVGTALLRSRLDGIERLYSYRHLEGFPLLVASARSREELLAGWRTTALQSSAVMLMVILVVGWGGARMLRQIRVRDTLEKELRSAGSALEERNMALKLQAEHDGLTGLANRRLFEETLAREHARAKRSGAVFSLILLDVDFFKKYNDRYGHVAGDDCLRQIGSAVASGARRPTDLAARYGGEEFAVILPDTDARGAAAVAASIRAAVAALGISHADGIDGWVTVSLGVVTGCPGTAKVKGATAWVGLADQMLYEAKTAGRNRAVAREEGVSA